jgi:hypothetical protein
MAAITPPRTTCAHTGSLSPYDRDQVVLALADAPSEISLEALAQPECFDQVRRSLNKLGATVDFSERKTGFVSLRLPSSRLRDVVAIRGIDDIGDVVLRPFVFTDSAPYIPQATRKPGPPPHIWLPWPHVTMKNKVGGAYFPASEIGLSAFWKQFPYADGRGVRIGLVDEGLDLLHPALRFAKDGDGHLVPKLAGIITTTRADQDVEWVVTSPVRLSANGSFRGAESEWQAPHAGKYRFGMLSWHSRDPVPSLPRDKPYALQISVGVLWDTKRDVVYVDTNGDRNFRNDVALPDYSKTKQIAWFGNFAHGWDERIGFAIHIDHARDSIFVDLGSGLHGAIVAGTLAANRLSGGLFVGAAPMAQIVDVRGTLPDTISQFIAAFADRSVDVINCSCRVGSNWLPKEAFERVVLKRALDVFRKPLVCLCSIDGAISVEDYQSGEDLRRNRKAPPPYREAVNNGLNSLTWSVPGVSDAESDILGPSASLTTQSRYTALTYPRGGYRQSLDFDGDTSAQPPAPDGYMIGENMSPTISLVSGVVADLISLAQVKHVRYDALRIRDALFASARILDHFPMSQQEVGLINVESAWRQLVMMSRVDDPTNGDLTHFDVFDSAGEAIDGYSEAFTRSVGAQVRTLWIVRRGGYSGDSTYSLSVRGDNASHSLAVSLLGDKIVLPRGRPVRISFRVTPMGGEGLAYLQLADSHSGTVMHLIPVHITTPEQMKVIGPGAARFDVTLMPRHVDNRYFSFPTDLEAVHATIEKPFGGATERPMFVGGSTSLESVRLELGGDDVRGSNLTLNHQRPPLGAKDHVGVRWRLEAAFAPPAALVRLYWENRGLPEYETPYEPPAAAVPEAASVQFDMYHVSVRRGGSSLTFTNDLAPLNGKIAFYAGTESMKHTIDGTPDGVAKAEVQIPPDATEIHVVVRSDSPDARGPFEAYLLECSHGSCSVVTRGNFERGVAHLTVSNACLSLCEGPTEHELANLHGSAVLVVANVNDITHHRYVVSEEVVRSIDGPESSFSERKSGDSWVDPIPSAPANDDIYWALRIRQSQTDGKDSGYLTRLTAVP